ncbi:MAG TPA: HTH domain-containing protein [Gammaproteobacteria bacterium]|nr:HTH domain-containing protein [Gammaproteobacteria bacterium]
MHTPTISAMGERQRALLTALLDAKEGLNADELAERLEISRSAVHQHLSALEKDGFLEKQMRPSTGGRPGYAWRLTDLGVHLFPKQYALFSDLMIRTMKKSLGSEGLARVLELLGADLAETYAARLRGKSPAEQVEAVADIMRELGYESRTLPDGQGRPPLIDARNCVYHHLARQHPEVCRLDLALLGALLDADIEHIECIVRGGAACRFRALARSSRER